MLFPARYAPRKRVPLTLFSRLLKQTPNRADRLRLLEAVDWDTPEVYTPPPWSDSPGRSRAELKRVHPLSAIARVGDAEVFARAVDLAYEKGTASLVVEDGSRQGLHLDDWVASRVVDAVAAFGTPEMMRTLVDKIAQRQDRTSLVTISQLGVDPVSDPLDALANPDGPLRSEDGCRRMIGEIERLYEVALLHQWPEWRAHGSPARDRIELKKKLHSHALEKAAAHGNTPMVRAILSMGVVQVDCSHVVAAIDSGGLDLVLVLLSKSPVPSQSWEGDEDEAQSSHTERDGPTLGARRLEELMFFLAQSMGRWIALDPSSPAARHRTMQLEAGDQVLKDLIGRYEKTPFDARSPHKQWTQQCTPMWLRQPPDIARRVAASLAGLAPTLQAWEGMAEHPDAPWVGQALDRLGSLGESETREYLQQRASLELEPNIARAQLLQSSSGLDADPDAVEHLPLPNMKVLAWVWKACKQNPHLPPLTEWVMGLQAVERLPEKIKSHLHQQGMDALLEEGSQACPSVPRPFGPGSRL